MEKVIRGGGRKDERREGGRKRGGGVEGGRKKGREGEEGVKQVLTVGNVNSRGEGTVRRQGYIHACNISE